MNIEMGLAILIFGPWSLEDLAKRARTHRVHGNLKGHTLVATAVAVFVDPHFVQLRSK